MKSYKIEYTKTAAHYIQKLSPLPKKGLKAVIEDLGNNPFLGKPLVEEFYGFRSLCFKRYRVIYQLDEELSIIKVVFAGHRKDVCQLFSDFFKKMRQ